MAQEFAPKLQTVTDVSALGADNPQSMSTLFQGLGNATLQAAQVFDTAVQNRIQQDAQQMFQDANQPYQDMVNGLPGDVKAQANRMAKLQTAYEQGKLSDTAYYSQLVAGTKRIKAKYPGYGNEIDKIIQQTTGVRPANALRNSLMQEIQSAQSQGAASERQWQSFISRKDVMETAITAFPDLYGNPEKYATPAERGKVQTVVAGLMAKQAAVGNMKETLAVDKAMFQRNKDQIDAQANEYIYATVNQSIAGLSGTFEKQYGANLQTMFNDLASGKRQLDAMEQQQLIGKLVGERNRIAGILQAQVSEGTNGFIDPTELKNKINDALMPYDNIISGMQTGNWDVVGMTARATKAMTERDLWNLKESEPRFRIFDTIKSISPDMANAYSQESGLAASISAMGMESINVDGKGLKEFIDKTLGTKKLSAGEKATGISTTLKMLGTQLADPKADPEYWSRAFDNTYNDSNILESFNGKSQIDVFKTLTSPKITQAIKNSGDSQRLQQYAGWAYQQLSQMSDIRQMAEDVNDISATRDFMSAEVQNGKIVFNVDVDAYEKWAKDSTARSQFEMRHNIQQTVRNIDQMNSILSTVVPIIEATGGDPSQTVPQILSNLSVDLNSRRNGWFQWTYDMLGNFDSSLGRKERSMINVKGLREFLNSRPELQPDKISYNPGEHKSPEILNMLGRAEGAGYNTVFSNAEGDYGWTPTNMTLREVFAAQKTLAKDTGSSAFGKYQVIQDTLKSAVKALGLPLDTKFTPQVQDQIATWLMEKRGYSKWKAGKITNEQFLNNMAKEWASVPTTSGRSYYAGDSMGNNATKGGRDFAAYILGTNV